MRALLSPTRPSGIAILLLILLLPTTAPAVQIGSEWAAPDIGNPFAVGDITPDPGLECIARDALGILKLVRLSDGASLASIPQPFNDAGTQYFLRDVDDDGLAEIVCLLATDPSGGAVGCLDWDRDLQSLWPIVADDKLTYAEIDFADLAADAPVAILLHSGRGLFIYSSQTGQQLYDSTLVLGAQWGVAALVVDDFDQDGNEEAFVEFSTGSGPGNSYRIDLIGDTSTPTAITGSSIGGMSLFQNRPNPMSGTTRIEYDLAAEGRVRLRVFDVAGRRVRTLVDGPRPAGRHATQWDGRDEGGVAVASGVYFYELDVEGQRSTRRLVRVR